jgi:hypothetical protein
VSFFVVWSPWPGIYLNRFVALWVGFVRWSSVKWSPKYDPESPPTLQCYFDLYLNESRETIERLGQVIRPMLLTHSKDLLSTKKLITM